MTSRDKILQFLSNNPNGACDDCISGKADVIPRQQVNQICRPLQKQGIIERTRKNCPFCKTFKIVNNMTRNANHPIKLPDKGNTTEQPRSWNWEGNIQSVIIQYLCENGYKIVRVANTENREQGKDIEATTPAGKTLWISVKGFPEKSANTQARHWFSQALFDMILYKAENHNAQLGIGLPDGVSTYLNLGSRISWFKEACGFNFFWVSQDGKVRKE